MLHYKNNNRTRTFVSSTEWLYAEIQFSLMYKLKRSANSNYRWHRYGRYHGSSLVTDVISITAASRPTTEFPNLAEYVL